jgi:hypothetical protein
MNPSSSSSIEIKALEKVDEKHSAKSLREKDILVHFLFLQKTTSELEDHSWKASGQTFHETPSPK